MSFVPSSQLPIGSLVDHIEQTHHVFTRAELARLDRLLRDVIAADAGKHPELTEVAGAFVRLADDLDPHMQKEEMILFPAIRKADQDFLEGPIRVMGIEHVQVKKILDELRTLTAGYVAPADATADHHALFAGLGNLQADLVEHIRLEDEVLFPRAMSL